MDGIGPEPQRQLSTIGDVAVEERLFQTRVAELRDAGLPIKLHLGPGPVPREGFLNIEKYVHHGPVDGFFERFPRDFINFPFAERAWPIPDACVDYIFHEDFIEHITQRQQILVLAEALRVMRPGAIHRINTPDLIASMRRSDFSRGFAGVFVEEWDRWGHLALFTRPSLEDVARMVGYRQVYFTAKDKGLSPYAIPDHRPWDDRDPIDGNIFADLLK